MHWENIFCTKDLLYIVNFRIKTAIAQGGMIKVLYKEAQEGGLFHPVWQVWKYIRFSSARFLCGKTLKRNTFVPLQVTHRCGKRKDRWEMMIPKDDITLGEATRHR